MLVARVHCMNIVAGLLLAGSAFAQTSSRDWASLIGQRFTVERDVPYRTVAGVTLKLDYYVPYQKTPGPTVIYIHGGGWQTFSKEQTVLWYLPYLELGMRVVAVQYRLSGVAAAPAGAEDCACAVRYIYEHAAERAIDPSRVLLTGGSAGGHLALLTGFGGIECPDHPGPLPRPTAILNYYGPTDLPTLEDTKALKRWLREAPVDGELARRLSPLNFIKPGRAAGLDNPRRRGRDGAVFPGNATHCRARQSPYSQPPRHHQWRTSWPPYLDRRRHPSCSARDRTIPGHPQNPDGEKIMRTILTLALALFALGSPALAQTITGSIVGTVVDASGASVRGAEASATQTATGAVRAAKTNEHGDFRFDTLQPGDYEVTITVPGFKTFKKTAPRARTSAVSSTRFTPRGTAPSAPACVTAIVYDEIRALRTSHWVDRRAGPRPLSARAPPRRRVLRLRARSAHLEAAPLPA